MAPISQIKCPSCGRRFTPDNHTGTTCPDCQTHIRTTVPPRPKVIRVSVVTGALAAAAVYLATGAFSPTVYWEQECLNADGTSATRQITDEAEARQLIRLNRSLAFAGYGEQAGQDADALERSITRANRAKSAVRIGFALCSLAAIALAPWLAWMIFLRHKNLLVLHCPSCDTTAAGRLDQLAGEKVCTNCQHAFTVAIETG